MRVRFPSPAPRRVQKRFTPFLDNSRNPLECISLTHADDVFWTSLESHQQATTLNSTSMKSSLFDSPLFADLPGHLPPQKVAPAPLATAGDGQEINATTLLALDSRFTEYIEQEVSRLSARTIRHYQNCYAVFRTFLSEGIELSSTEFEQRIRDLDEYAAWHRKRGIAPITVNTYWRALGGFFRYLEEKHSFQNPYRTHRAPRFQAPPPKALASAECQRILVAAANYPNWTHLQRARAVALLGTMLYAGLRRGETIRLVNTDVDLAQGAIRVEKGKGPNGGKTRFVDINPDLHRILRAYLRERDRVRVVAPEFFTLLNGKKPLTISAVSQIVLKISEAAHVEFSAHKLRHSFVTHLLRAGVDLHVVRDLAGHSSISTTLGYTRVFSEDRKRAVKRLSF